MQRGKWPLMCFVAVAFLNMLGAGVFGFMINTPVALFYLQGLNTTAVHAHAALFGVYGFLSLGFVLLILRYLRPDMPFNDRRSEEHTSELQSLMRISYAVFCLKKKNNNNHIYDNNHDSLQYSIETNTTSHVRIT